MDCTCTRWIFFEPGDPVSLHVAEVMLGQVLVGNDLYFSPFINL